MCALFAAKLFIFHALVSKARAYESEIISDLTGSKADEGRALEIKAKQFWQPILAAAEDTKLSEHLQLYADADEVVAELPASNKYVHDALVDALVRLKRADRKVLSQAATSMQIASEQLASPVAWESGFNFLTAGQQFLAQAVRRFVWGARYQERVSGHLRKRQVDVLPALQEMSEISSNVLTDCREASKLAFDVLKYDIYNKDVPKTPQAAKDLADRIVKAVGETRHYFLKGVTAAAESIAKDANGKHEEPSATVTRALMSDLKEEPPEEPLLFSNGQLIGKAGLEDEPSEVPLVFSNGQLVGQAGQESLIDL